MVKVTGFTAERMLQIENSTVVDGEVQSDQLILLTRAGTPIDAGNVRGPKGDQGIPGPVQSVNGQTGTVSAPRIFANKAAIDSGWPSAPTGSVAVTTDTESMWTKSSTGWFLTNPIRIFTSATELSSKWGNAPEGSYAATTDPDVVWYKVATGWNIDSGVRVFSNIAERNERWPTPPLGATCFTVDNYKSWQYRDVGWREFPWNCAWGRLSVFTSPGVNFGPGVAYVPGAGQTINLGPPGERLLRVTYSYSLYNTYAGPNTLGVFQQYAGGIPDGARRYQSIYGQGWNSSGVSIYDYISGNDIVHFGVECPGTGLIDRIFISVDDVGPYPRL